MPAVVGIPRTLSYYTYYPLWKTFLERLGFEVALSCPTNIEILEHGVKETVSDACIPIKVFHGHVAYLKDRVDYLLVPRFISADGRSTFCPKFLGLPDMVRYSGLKLPPIIDSRFRVGKIPGGVLRFLREVSGRLGVGGSFLTVKAALAAIDAQKIYERLLQEGLPPQQALGKLDEKGGGTAITASGGGAESESCGLTVALLGYPYAIYDPFVSANLYARLHAMGVRMLTPEQVPPALFRRLSRVLPQNFFWHYSNRVSWTTLYLLEREKALDGIIHVTAFGCGPDAMVDKLVELEAKKAMVPFLTLSIDEHTGEGGLQTRLEAFVDMLLARKERAGREAGNGSLPRN